jgi:hypothetical protein
VPPKNGPAGGAPLPTATKATIISESHQMIAGAESNTQPQLTADLDASTGFLDAPAGREEPDAGATPPAVRTEPDAGATPLDRGSAAGSVPARLDQVVGGAHTQLGEKIDAGPKKKKKTVTGGSSVEASNTVPGGACEEPPRKVTVANSNSKRKTSSGRSPEEAHGGTRKKKKKGDGEVSPPPVPLEVTSAEPTPFGLFVIKRDSLKKALGFRMEADDAGDVAVCSVSAGSPTARSGLQVGMKVAKIDHYYPKFAKKPDYAGRPVLLLVDKRGRTTRFSEYISHLTSITVRVGSHQTDPEINPGIDPSIGPPPDCKIHSTYVSGWQSINRKYLRYYAKSNNFLENAGCGHCRKRMSDELAKEPGALDDVVVFACTLCNREYNLLSDRQKTCVATLCAPCKAELFPTAATRSGGSH